jgi:hypothetical protein
MSARLVGVKRPRSGNALDSIKAGEHTKALVGAQNRSGTPDTPSAAAPHSSACGSQRLGGGHWSRLASAELPTVSAASSGIESDTAAAQPMSDGRRRSRKATAPRR